MWISAEDSYGRDIRPRILAQGGVEERVKVVHKRLVFPDDLWAIRATCQQEDIGLVVIDPIISVLGGAPANDEAACYNALGPLNELADNLDTAVIGVRHIGKNSEYDALESVLGSVAFVNIPRAVLNVAQTETQIPMGGVSRMVSLSVLASNRVRALSSAWFHLNEVNVSGVTKPVPMVVPGEGVVS